jgi:5-formyltetrahydrofolate cyclo-ligase
MKKSEIRKLYLQKRKTLSSDEVLSLSEKIFQNFIHYFKPISGNQVHVFIPIEKLNEIKTNLLIDYFFKNKIRVFVPKMIGENLISIEINSETQFLKNTWGIFEPESNEDSGIVDFDFVITPLLYCDHKGSRVGYGKGFYDELFKNIEQNSLKIGVNFFPPNENIEDIWENDIPLDYLITPTEVLSF